MGKQKAKTATVVTDNKGEVIHLIKTRLFTMFCGLKHSAISVERITL